MKCEWVILEPSERKIREISKKHDISELMAKILINKGISDDDEIDYFLNPESRDFFDPFLLQDMEKLTNVLLKIRDKKESIAVYGDYDVDGVTSTAMVYSILKKLGWKVSHYIPSRLIEGYGLSKNAIQDLFNKGIKNILTVDCGITSFEEVKYANFLQFKVMITDHHDVQNQLPDATAIVNPKRKDDNYPDEGLAGVGVAFKVMDALLRKLGNPVDISEFLDLVTLGTVADIVPLRGENRIIVKKGLKHLAETKRIGLRKLMEISGINIDQIKTHDIGFKIAPKLNAVGRLESAEEALKLLLSEDESEALVIAQYLSDQNLKRQTIENQIFKEAEFIIENNPKINEMPVLILSKENWHPGVIGIVSSRLAAKYYKPALMISTDHEEGIGRGSARSIEQVNIMELFNNSSKFFKDFGGHPMAAGFTIESNKIDLLRKEMTEVYERIYGRKSFTSTIMIDSKLRLQDIDELLLNDIDRLRPFGQGNHEPIFLIENASIERLKFLGNRSQHMRMIFKQGDLNLDGIGFNVSSYFEDFRYIRPNLLRLDAVGSLKTLWHYGVKHTQFFLKDLKLSIDPQFKEEEEDKSFVFGLMKNWQNQSVSHHIQDLQTIKTDYFHRIKTKYSVFEEFIDTGENLAAFTNLKIQEIILILSVISNLEKNKKVLVLSPSNSFSNYRYNVLKRFNFISASFINSLKSGDSESPCVFSTIPFVYKRFEEFDKKYDSIFFTDMEFLFYKKVGNENILEQMIYLVNSFSNRVNFLGTRIGLVQKELFKKKIPIKKIIAENFPKISRGLVDKRDISDPIKYVHQLVKNGEFVVLITNSPSKTVEYTRILGKKMADIFHNGEVVFYNNKLTPFQRTRIEELVSEGKIRLLITTTQFGPFLNFQDKTNICFLEIPSSPLELFSLSNSIQGKKPSIIFHLLYNREDIENYRKSFSDFFPDKEKIINVLEKVCGNGSINSDQIKESLVRSGIITEKSWTLYKQILTELGVLESEKVINKEFLKLKVRIDSLSRLVEGEIDKRIVNIYTKAFNDFSAKEILEVLDCPLKPFV